MKQRYLTILMLLLALAGCDRKAGVEPQAEQTGADPVLAKVGKSAVHQSEFDAMMERLTPEARKRDSTKLNDTILQGLVRTRALAIVTEQQLSAEERRKIDAKVKLYKDELLAQSYMQKNVTPQPVTRDMVEKYYNDHKDEYTTPGKVQFEYLETTSKPLDDAGLDKVMKAFSTAKNVNNWKAYADKLKKQKLPVAYKSANMVPTSVIKVLQTQVNKLKAGETGDIVFGDYVYVVKVIKKDPDVVKPLNQVSVEIRKKLAPQKLKQVLTQHIDEALKSVEVTYVK